ncbi:MAG: site-specific integrase [Patescibacteria group bacterium]|nr:site-specific integrase [Patescibacteria group bacterium]
MARLRRESRWSANTRAANDRSFGRFSDIEHVPLADIDRAAVAEARSLLIDDGLAPASVNRHMAVFGQVLRAATGWGWLKDAPPVAMINVPERDPTTLTADSFARLLAELPAHLRGPALLAVTTGLRMANVRDLTWGQVHLEQGHITIPASLSKTRKALTVPLTPVSAAVLASIERVPGMDRVFTYRPFRKGGEGERAAPRPITGTFNARAFRKARERAGVAARWHDLRHTFASWAAVAGAPDRVLQSLGGWSSPAMLTRYAHLNPGDTRSWASAASANAVAAISAVMPEVAAKVQENQAVEVVPTHRIELWTPSLRNPESSHAFQQNQSLGSAATRADTGQNRPSGGSSGANVVARFPGRRK